MWAKGFRVQVAQQCKENIFAIQTLKDFQFVEDNKDQGLNVREKAKALVALLKDDERLKNERTRALKAKERFAQSTQGEETINKESWYKCDYCRVSSRPSWLTHGLTGRWLSTEQIETRHRTGKVSHHSYMADIYLIWNVCVDKKS